VITCEVLDCHNAETNLHILQERANKLVELVKSLNYTIYRIRPEKRLNFDKIEEIILKQYDSQSQYLNDYLFLPATRKIEELLMRQFYHTFKLFFNFYFVSNAILIHLGVRI
jgi:hypothetical protein